MDLAEAAHPERCVLVVVDVQNNFCHPDGSSARLGNDVAHYARMVETRLAPLIGRAREAGVPLVFVRMEPNAWRRNPATADLGLRPLLPYGEEDGEPPEARPPLHDEAWERDYFVVRPEPGDYEITKDRYSAFIGTDLDLVLRSRRVESVILTGVAGNVCVESTARDAFQLGYRVLFVKDCTASRDAGQQRATEINIHKFFGTVVTSDDLVAAWHRLRAPVREAPGDRF